MHTFMLSNPEAIEATVRFLETGHFSQRTAPASRFTASRKKKRTVDLNTKVSGGEGEAASHNNARLLQKNPRGLQQKTRLAREVTEGLRKMTFST